MLIDLLPPALAQDPTARPVALAAGVELSALEEAAPMVGVLSRIDELARPMLDAVARYLGVDFYDPTADDHAVRTIIAGAFTWHRRRGTPWALRWAFETLGIDATVYEQAELRAFAEAAGVRHLDGTWAVGDDDPPVFLTAYSLNTARPLLRHWAEFLIEADLDAAGNEWGPQVERAVTLGAPARAWPVFFLAIDDTTDPAATAAFGRARAALGSGYALSSFLVLEGLPLDGSWTLETTAIVGRRVPARSVVLDSSSVLTDL